MSKVSVIGAGLAGCEAAWALARRGIDVTLYEMKPVKYSPAHHYEGFAELVCSNSLKAMRLNSAAGLLKAEMKAMDSLVVRCAEQTAVSAGGALAVDREAFSDAMSKAIRELPNVTVVTGEVTELPAGNVIVASGPLTSEALSETIGRLCGEKYLSFYDASAPLSQRTPLIWSGCTLPPGTTGARRSISTAPSTKRSMRRSMKHW